MTGQNTRLPGCSRDTLPGNHFSFKPSSWQPSQDGKASITSARGGEKTSRSYRAPDPHPSLVIREWLLRDKAVCEILGQGRMCICMHAHIQLTRDRIKKNLIESGERSTFLTSTRNWGQIASWYLSAYKPNAACVRMCVCARVSVPVCMVHMYMRCVYVVYVCAYVCMRAHVCSWCVVCVSVSESENASLVSNLVRDPVSRE